jgi:hypothetical protein
MYACIRKIGARFFEGVCPPSSATAHLRDPPPPRNTKEPEPCNGAPARCGSLAALPTSSSESTWIGGWQSSMCIFQRTHQPS